MKITIAKNEAAFDTLAAWRVIGEILSNPKAVIGLSTGRTTKNLHQIIAKLYTMHPFDISQVTLFGVDEVINVPREYAGACYTMLKNELIDALGIDENQFIMPQTISDDLDAVCRVFQEAIESRGGADLQLLGLGENGHLGFNQPGSPFESETWITHMDEALEVRIRKETKTPPEKKLGGLTLGLKNIMQSRKIILLAKGRRKAHIVKQMLEGPITPDVPTSILQLHPNCEFIFDTEAAAEIKKLF
jgi:glucosamine-6-phosphate deaminase